MGELGEWLRQHREERGLSLAQVEEATRIRLKYLQAMEEEDFGQLPPEVYLRGLLRQYADYLGLDPQEAIDLYRRARPEPEIAPVVGPSVEVSPPSAIWLYRDLIIGVAILVAIGAFAFWGYQQYTRVTGEVAPILFPSPRATSQAVTKIETTATAVPPTATATPLTTVQVTPTAQPPVTETSTAVSQITPTAQPPATETSTAVSQVTPTPTGTATPTPTPTLSAPGASPSPVSPLTIRVQITERTWLHVIVDGREAFRGILVRGDEQSWTGFGQIMMRSGNASGVTVFVNEQEEGILGERGAVVDRQWSLDQEGNVVVSVPKKGAFEPTPTPRPRIGFER
ncbi:MAG: RodZ domain-containing protein [Anaerolineae bacterium]